MKQTIESNKPRDNFMQILNKRYKGKRLSQRDRIFHDLYMNDWLPCYYYSKQMKPAIMNYRARISELRNHGFIIECKTSYRKHEKHSEYRLDKLHVEIEKKRKWWWGW